MVKVAALQIPEAIASLNQNLSCHSGVLNMGTFILSHINHLEKDMTLKKPTYLRECITEYTN